LVYAWGSNASNYYDGDSYLAGKVMIITTNNHWRQFKYRNEVPKEVLLKEFDWMIPKEIKDDPAKVELWCKGEIFPEYTDGQDYLDGFFKYRNWWYHLSQFMRDQASEGWDGGLADTMFSGVVIKISKDCERYKVGSVRA